MRAKPDMAAVTPDRYVPAWIPIPGAIAAAVSNGRVNNAPPSLRRPWWKEILRLLPEFASAETVRWVCRDLTGSERVASNPVCLVAVPDSSSRDSDKCLHRHDFVL